MPITLTSGRRYNNKSNCAAIGHLSLVPVMLPPGFSNELTNPAVTGSVTAPKTNGISVPLIACAQT
jgi:hypothetical protein